MRNGGKEQVDVLPADQPTAQPRLEIHVRTVLMTLDRSFTISKAILMT